MIEAMGMVFAAVLFPREAVERIALAIWHSTMNDRTQTGMLKAAAVASAGKFEKALPKFSEDIKWLCDSAQSLADHRNIVAHAPLTFRLDNQGQAIGVVASTFFGHPRAAKLTGKDLISTFQTYRTFAEALKLFSVNIYSSIRFGGTVHAWPDRPALPKLRQKKSPPNPRRQPQQ
jgi:hypothetical protein